MLISLCKSKDSAGVSQHFVVDGEGRYELKVGLNIMLSLFKSNHGSKREKWFHYG